MNTNKQSLAFEEINAAVGIYDFRVTVETDKENLSALDNSPFIIAFKATISQGKRTLGIGRANSILGPRNKFTKSATIYCFNAAIVDGFSKAVKILDNLPLKADAPKESLEEDQDLEGRDKPAFYTQSDDLKYASQKQKDFCFKLLNNGKCKDQIKKQQYLDSLKSPYISSFQASEIISSLLLKK